MTDQADDVDQTKFGSTKLGQALGVLLSIIAAWCLATAAVYSRKLKNIPAKVVLFYHGVIGMIAAGVYWIVEAIFKGEVRTYSWNVFGVMVASCLIDTLACFMMTMAYQLDTSGFMSLLFYISIVYAYLADVFILEEPIELLEIAGVLLIFVTTFTVAVIKLRESMREKKNAVEADDQVKVGGTETNAER